MQPTTTFAIPTYRLRDVGETVERYDESFWRNGNAVPMVVFDDSSPATRDKYQLGQDQKGVVITDVTSGTPASDRGLKPGDVIVEVQQEQVGSPGDVQAKVVAVRKQNRKSVLMLIQSSDGLRWVPLSLDHQPG
jgi:S1-C subfamily serine protease